MADDLQFGSAVNMDSFGVFLVGILIDGGPASVNDGGVAGLDGVVVVAAADDEDGNEDDQGDGKDESVLLHGQSSS